MLERENCFVREDEEKKWKMPGILGSHYLSPFQKTKAMFGPTKERGEKVKPGDAAKAGYYSTEAAKTSFPNTPETIDFLLRELNEKVYPNATTIQTTTSKKKKNFFSIKASIPSRTASASAAREPQRADSRKSFNLILQQQQLKATKINILKVNFSKKNINDGRKMLAVTAVGAVALPRC